MAGGVVVTVPEASRTRPANGRAESDPLLRVNGVTVRFGGLTALDDVSLDVLPGEVHGVIGPNGAGKTTLFNVCCGFVAPEAGALTWRGDELGLLRPHELAAMGIARTLQGLGLFAGLTVLENVMIGADRFRGTGFGSALFGLRRGARDERALRERAYEAMRAVEVAEHASRAPESLPYAVRKRVAFARALAAEPVLLLLDEPAAGLGATELSELAELVAGLTERMAVVLVDHHMDLVMDVCERITVLDFGRVVASGPPARVRDDRAVIDAYLGEVAERHAPGQGGDDERR